MENRPPCLISAGSSPSPSCGTQCFGPSLDYSRLGLTQLVSVGFGNASSLNGSTLTLTSERQGGVYLQNPNGPGSDLKHYFVKAFGAVSGESVLIDPEGILQASDAAAPAVEHNSCGEGSLTFSAVWDKAIDPGDLRLIVTSPSGDLVLGGDPRVESSSERLWSNVRVDTPYRGAQAGLWRAELVRPHTNFVNGFSPAAFVDIEDGTTLARQLIHKLCPDGCKRVLYYENGFDTDSAYARALKRELNAGSIADLTDTADPDKYADALQSRDWDLVVHAQGGDDRPYNFDPFLAKYLCGGGRAIISDARRKSSAVVLRCAGALNGGNFDGKAIRGEPSSISSRTSRFAIPAIQRKAGH